MMLAVCETLNDDLVRLCYVENFAQPRSHFILFFRVALTFFILT